MPERLSPKRLAEIRARCEAATPGPWEETWRPVPGYEGLYDVSDMGRVRSYLKPGRNLEKMAATPRGMSEYAGRGYKTVALTKDGKYRTYRVHRLVLETFVGPAPPRCEGAHLNGNRLDNRLSNLAWASHRENEHHKRDHGTVPKGEANGGSRLVGWQVAEIRYLAAKGVPQAKMAGLFDISRSVVSSVVSGESWPETEARQDIPALLAHIAALDAEIAEVLDSRTEAYRANGELKDALAAAKDKNERLRGLLREWTDQDPLRYDSEYSCCPWCDFSYSHMEHEPDCAFVLARAECRKAALGDRGGEG